MGCQNLVEHDTLAATNVYQFYNAIFVVFWAVFEGAKVEMAGNWNCDIDTCHASLECLQFLWILHHDAPHRRSLLLVVGSIRVPQWVIGLSELAAGNKILVKVVHVLKPLIVPMRGKNNISDEITQPFHRAKDLLHGKEQVTGCGLV